MTVRGAAFILRVRCKNGELRLLLLDLKTGQQETFASWAALGRYVGSQLGRSGLR